VTEPVSVKVPVYGPVAIPETEKVNVEVPEGLHVPPVMVAAGSEVSESYCPAPNVR